MAQSSVLALPNRKELGGRILKEVADLAVADGIKMLTRNVEINGASLGLSLDGFETTGHQHFTGVVVHSCGLSVPFDIVQDGADHHGIALARSMEETIIKIEDELGHAVVSVCTDDAGKLCWLD